MTNLRNFKKSIICFFLAVAIFSCKKSETITPEEISLEITVADIVNWQKEFVRRYPEFNNIDLRHSQKTQFRNKHIVRVPFGQNGNSFYFYKTAERGLESFIIRPDYKDINGKEAVSGLNLLNLNNQLVHKLIYTKGIVSNTITYTKKSAGISAEGKVAVQESWLSAFLGCIAKHVFSVPYKISDGEYGCWVFGFAESGSSGSTGGGPIVPFIVTFPPSFFVLPPFTGDTGGGGDPLGNWGASNPGIGSSEDPVWEAFYTKYTQEPQNMQRASVLASLIGYSYNTDAITYFNAKAEINVLINKIKAAIDANPVLHVDNLIF